MLGPLLEAKVSERGDRVTVAVAQRNEGPISSMRTSTTERFSPSAVS